jgi:hypothetical protein
MAKTCSGSIIYIHAPSTTSTYLHTRTPNLPGRHFHHTHDTPRHDTTRHDTTATVPLTPPQTAAANRARDLEKPASVQKISSQRTHRVSENAHHTDTLISALAACPTSPHQHGTHTHNKHTLISALAACPTSPHQHGTHTHNKHTLQPAHRPSSSSSSSVKHAQSASSRAHQTYLRACTLATEPAALVPAATYAPRKPSQIVIDKSGPPLSPRDRQPGSRCFHAFSPDVA